MAFPYPRNNRKGARGSVEACLSGSHQIAQRVEQAAVSAAGISWREYNQFIQKQVDPVSKNACPRLPPDLDFEPYRDEQDWEELRHMQRGRDHGNGKEAKKSLKRPERNQ